MKIPTLQDIQEAAQRIAPHVHRTPVLTCETLNQRSGASLFFKCENLQKAGVFKIRGATNAVLSLSKKEAARGVATHSSGNHGAALSLAARGRDIPSYVVMPKTAPDIKKEAVAEYGAEITFCKPTLKAREDTLDEVVKKTGATFIHPYDNPKVVTGQGTCALELLDEVPDLDVIMAPVGGGGLLSGTAIASTSLSPGIQVIAGEPTGADDACRSFHDKKRYPSVDPKTIADGLLTSLGKLTFPIILEHVTDILTVNDWEIIDAMRLLWERMKMVVEPSSAVPLAALLEHKERFAGKKVGIILSGGNVDLNNLPWISL